jgi:hypothetical protein
MSVRGQKILTRDYQSAIRRIEGRARDHELRRLWRHCGHLYWLR